MNQYIHWFIQVFAWFRLLRALRAKRDSSWWKRSAFPSVTNCLTSISVLTGAVCEIVISLRCPNFWAKILCMYNICIPNRSSNSCSAKKRRLLLWNVLDHCNIGCVLCLRQIVYICRTNFGPICNVSVVKLEWGKKMFILALSYFPPFVNSTNLSYF